MQSKIPHLPIATHLIATRLAASCCAAALVFIFPSANCHAQAEPAPEKKEEGAQVRMLCVQGLTEKDEEVILATKTGEGKWKELGKVTIRSSYITEWMPVPQGLTHLVRKEGDELKSIGSFTIEPKQRRALLILLPDTKNKVYRIQVIDPTKADFRKGKAMILNYGDVPAVVRIGNATVTVAPGKQAVQTIGADSDGMCRLLIGHIGKDKEIVPCYDRFVSSNPNARKFILLFPDRDTGLRAMSLSEFGPFE